MKHLKQIKEGPKKIVRGLNQTKLCNSYSSNVKNVLMMALLWLLIALLISMLIIILHIFALSLLLKVKLVSYSASQKYLLVSLSLTELSFGVSMFADIMGNLLGLAEKLHMYLQMFQLIPLYLMYLSIMMILTLDRFLEFRFNIKYPLIWLSKKTLIVLCLLLCISPIIFICMLPISDKINSHRKYLLGYIYAPIACVYLLLASLTYYQIFKKIQENKKKARELKECIRKDQPNRNANQIQVFLPSFIILTFLLFNIFPILLMLLYDFVFTEEKWMVGLLIILTLLGWIADPLIYIFNLKSVRKKVLHSFEAAKKVMTSKDIIVTQSRYF